MHIASRIYDEAEKHFNDIITPSGAYEGDEIEEFWKNRTK